MFIVEVTVGSGFLVNVKTFYDIYVETLLLEL